MVYESYIYLLIMCFKSLYLCLNRRVHTGLNCVYLGLKSAHAGLNRCHAGLNRCHVGLNRCDSGVIFQYS